MPMKGAVRVVAVDDVKERSVLLAGAAQEGSGGPGELRWMAADAVVGDIGGATRGRGDGYRPGSPAVSSPMPGGPGDDTESGPLGGGDRAYGKPMDAREMPSAVEKPAIEGIQIPAAVSGIKAPLGSGRQGCGRFYRRV